MNDRNLREILTRLTELERKVSQLYALTGTSEPSPRPPAPPSPDSAADVDPETLELIRRGSLVDAIKRHRAVTGLGLAEAKEEVDRLATSLRSAG